MEVDISNCFISSVLQNYPKASGFTFVNALVRMLVSCHSEVEITQTSLRDNIPFENDMVSTVIPECFNSLFYAQQ